MDGWNFFDGVEGGMPFKGSKSKFKLYIPMYVHIFRRSFIVTPKEPDYERINFSKTIPTDHIRPHKQCVIS